MVPSSGVQRAGGISFRQLRLFAAIGDLTSVRRASEECGLSQPAVTQALAKMEAQIGTALVDRRASGSYLNPLGEVFHARVKRFFDQAEQAVITIDAAASDRAARSIVNRLTRSQTRALVAVIESGSFERAAQQLDVSLGSLQRAARDLESNLHAPLFYRTAAGMLVNPQGAQFGLKMKLALQEIELGLEEVDAAGGGSSRQLVIGAMPFGGSMLLASVLDDFLRLHPCADIQIINEGAAEMAQRLRAGDVDFVIGLLPELDSCDVVREPLAQTPYSIVVRRGHPLTRKGQVTLEHLTEYDWMIGIGGSSRRACFEGLFAGREGPRVSIATCSLPVIRHLIERSDRLTLMTSYELQHEDGQIRAVPFGPITPIPSIGITKRANWMPTRLHADFIELIRAHVSPPVHELRRQAG
jgi:DNA-binding transcriptional LysR family regulator